MDPYGPASASTQAHGSSSTDWTSVSTWGELFAPGAPIEALRNGRLIFHPVVVNGLVVPFSEAGSSDFEPLRDLQAQVVQHVNARVASICDGPDYSEQMALIRVYSVLRTGEDADGVSLILMAPEEQACFDRLRASGPLHSVEFWDHVERANVAIKADFVPLFRLACETKHASALKHWVDKVNPNRYAQVLGALQGADSVAVVLDSASDAQDLDDFTEQVARLSDKLSEHRSPQAVVGAFASSSSCTAWVGHWPANTLPQIIQADIERSVNSPCPTREIVVKATYAFINTTKADADLVVAKLNSRQLFDGTTLSASIKPQLAPQVKSGPPKLPQVKSGPPKLPQVNSGPKKFDPEQRSTEHSVWIGRWPTGTDDRMIKADCIRKLKEINVYGTVVPKGGAPDGAYAFINVSSANDHSKVLSGLNNLDVGGGRAVKTKLTSKPTPSPKKTGPGRRVLENPRVAEKKKQTAAKPITRSLTLTDEQAAYIRKNKRDLGGAAKKYKVKIHFEEASSAGAFVVDANDDDPKLVITGQRAHVEEAVSKIKAVLASKASIERSWTFNAATKLLIADKIGRTGEANQKWAAEYNLETARLRSVPSSGDFTLVLKGPSGDVESAASEFERLLNRPSSIVERDCGSRPVLHVLRHLVKQRLVAEFGKCVEHGHVAVVPPPREQVSQSSASAQGTSLKVAISASSEHGLQIFTDMLDATLRRITKEQIDIGTRGQELFDDKGSYLEDFCVGLFVDKQARTAILHGLPDDISDARSKIDNASVQKRKMNIGRFQWLILSKSPGKIRRAGKCRVHCDKYEPELALCGTKSDIDETEQVITAHLDEIRRQAKNESVYLPQYQAAVLEREKWKLAKDIERKFSVAVVRADAKNQRHGNKKRFGSGEVLVVQGDLTREQTDAIVNPANNSLQNAGGLARQICDAAGPQLQRACSLITRDSQVPDGENEITQGYDLAAAYVIHFVAPMWRDGRSGETDTIRQGIQKVLFRAEANGCTSVSIPPVGMGIFGNPTEITSKAIVEGVAEFLDAHRHSCVRTIRLIADTEDKTSALQKALLEVNRSSFSQFASMKLGDNNPYGASDFTLDFSKSEVDRAFVATHQWFWKDDDMSFVPYDSDQNIQIEQAFLAGQSEIGVVGDRGQIKNGNSYRVFGLQIVAEKGAYQENMKTHWKRIVAREPIRGGAQMGVRSEGRVTSDLPVPAANALGGWTWLDDNGHRVPYEEPLNADIERAYQKNKTGTMSFVLPGAPSPYSIDFGRMKQISPLNNERDVDRGHRALHATNPFSTNPNAENLITPGASLDSSSGGMGAAGRNTEYELTGIPRDVDNATRYLDDEIGRQIERQEFKDHGKWDSDEQRALRRLAVAVKVLVEFDSRGYCSAEGHAEAVHKFRYHLLEKSNEKLRTRDSADSYPADWDPMPAGKSVITKLLDPQSPAFQKIEARLKETVPGAQVHQIEIVQNTLCWDSFSSQKKVLQKKWPNKKPEDLSKFLFHGTGATEPSNVYSSMNGLDRNFSRAGMWGPGVYLATDAKYSDKAPYVHTRADGKKQLFFAEALTGVSKNMPSDGAIQMPPELDDQALRDEVTGDTSSLQRYDSVNGTTQNCLVYILYDNFRVYPRYLITYEG